MSTIIFKYQSVHQKIKNIYYLPYSGKNGVQMSEGSKHTDFHISKKHEDNDQQIFFLFFFQTSKSFVGSNACNWLKLFSGCINF